MSSVSIADVDYLIFYNGYAEDMRTYLSVNKAAWTCQELWFPYGANIVYGPKRKSRLQIICEHLNSDIFSSYIYNQYTRVDALITLGANPEIEDTDGMTPLMICARDGWEEHVYMARWLIRECGADVNRKNKHGYTALHQASVNNMISMVKELLDNGADVNSRTSDNFRPIHWAAYRGNLTIVKMLVEKGAELDSTVMSFVIRYQSDTLSILRYLHKKGCPLPENAILIALENKNYRSITYLVKKAGADPNEIYDTHTLLDMYIDTPDAVLALCDAGADVNLLSNTIPVVVSAVNEPIWNLNVLKTLSKYRANFNLQSRIGGKTPLHIIVETITRPVKKEELLYTKQLLKNPIDFTVLDTYGSTALQIAQSKGLTDIVWLSKRAMFRQKMKV